MKTARLHRLFNPRSGRCLDVAVDHGFFNEGSFLAGIEDLPKAVATLVAAAPDAIQLTVGQAPHLQRMPVRAKPALVLRTDVANVYGARLPRTLFSRMIDDPVGQALRLDAACVVVNLFCIPDQPELADQCIQNILRLKPACDTYSMPLMVEPLVFQADAKAGGYGVDGDPAKIIPLVRQAVELGADIIKADPTDDVVSQLATAAPDGEQLTDVELGMFLIQLLVAGNETTRNLLSGGLAALAARPRQWALLAADPRRIATAVEELLRWTTPVISFMRTATRPTELCGQEVAEGEPVLCLYASANRDEDVFGPDAGDLDVTRDPNPHVSFGFGVHFCLGAALGRLEARVVLEELLARFSTMSPAGDVVRAPSPVIAGVRRAPVVVTAR